MDQVKVCYAVMGLDGPDITATKLRGYLGHVFADTPEFHHHMENPYHYPLIQYKRLSGGKYMVMGFAAYADVLYDKIKDVETVVTRDQKLAVRTVEISKKSVSVENVRPVQYVFQTPWIALNAKNYERYRAARHKKPLLCGILVGNILSAFKGLGIRISFPVMVDITRFDERSATAHENRFAGFGCRFRANISLIPFMGLGKSVSKGFGMVNLDDS